MYIQPLAPPVIRPFDAAWCGVVQSEIMFALRQTGLHTPASALDAAVGDLITLASQDIDADLNLQLDAIVRHRRLRARASLAWLDARSQIYSDGHRRSSPPPGTAQANAAATAA
jgi:hypothetical protein